MNKTLGSLSTVLIALAVSIIGLAGALAAPAILLAMRRTVQIAVELLILWYLLRPSTRAALGKAR